jgi:hypothetical protein
MSSVNIAIPGEGEEDFGKFRQRDDGVTLLTGTNLIKSNKRWLLFYVAMEFFGLTLVCGVSVAVGLIQHSPTLKHKFKS